MYTLVKFIFSEKATKFYKISTVNLTVTTLHRTNLRWRFRKKLWPFQNIWTLPNVLWLSFDLSWNWNLHIFIQVLLPFGKNCKRSMARRGSIKMWRGASVQFYLEVQLKPWDFSNVIILISPDLIPHVPQDSLQLKIIKGAFLEQSPFMLHFWHSSNSSLQPCSMAIRVVEFSNGGYKIRKIYII